MAMSTSRETRPAPSSAWTAVIVWSTLSLSTPLLTVAAWFTYDAATSSSEWAALGFLVTVAVAVPVVPAVVLAVVALRSGEPGRARVLAVIAALLVASVPLLGAWLGLA
jgi:zinc transporter ZupT